MTDLVIYVNGHIALKWEFQIAFLGFLLASSSIDDRFQPSKSLLPCISSGIWSNRVVVKDGLSSRLGLQLAKQPRKISKSLPFVGGNMLTIQVTVIFNYL